MSTDPTKLRLNRQSKPDVAEIEARCPKCGTAHRIYAKFANIDKIDKDMSKKKIAPWPKDDKIKCSCGFENDISGIKTQLESDFGRKMVLGGSNGKDKK